MQQNSVKLLNIVYFVVVDEVTMIKYREKRKEIEESE